MRLLPPGSQDAEAPCRSAVQGRKGNGARLPDLRRLHPQDLDPQPAPRRGQHGGKDPRGSEVSEIPCLVEQAAANSVLSKRPQQGPHEASVSLARTVTALQPTSSRKALKLIQPRLGHCKAEVPLGPPWPSRGISSQSLLEVRRSSVPFIKADDNNGFIEIHSHFPYIPRRAFQFDNGRVCPYHRVSLGREGDRPRL